MKTENTLYVLSGPPRCGKSTWAREKAKQLASEGLGCPIVSGDALRRALYHRRFWMPGDKLIGPYAWVMVRALFVAGHQNVIVDDTNLDKGAIGSWACGVKTTTPHYGGRDYPPLLAVDMVGNETAKSEADLADELQGDIIAWKRHVAVFSTSLAECESRAEMLRDYNQRSTLIKFIRLIGDTMKWSPDFIREPGLLAPGETYEFVGELPAKQSQL